MRTRGRLRLLDLLLAQRFIRVDDEQEAQQHAVRAQRDAQPRPGPDPLIGGQPHRTLRLFDVAPEIFDVLDTDADAQEILGDDGALGGVAGAAFERALVLWM